ncbi:uncharacterized protein LOC144733141 [Lampetra planeri]
MMILSLFPSLCVLSRAPTLREGLRCSNESGADFIGASASGALMAAVTSGYRVVGWNGRGWQPLLGSMRRVSVGGAHVWGVTLDKKLYRVVDHRWYHVADNIAHVFPQPSGAIYVITVAKRLLCGRGDPLWPLAAVAFEDDGLPTTCQHAACNGDECWALGAADGLAYVKRTAGCGVGGGWEGFTDVRGAVSLLAILNNGDIYSKSSTQIYVRPHVYGSATWQLVNFPTPVQFVGANGTHLLLITNIIGSLLICEV